MFRISILLPIVLMPVLSACGSHGGFGLPDSNGSTQLFSPEPASGDISDAAMAGFAAGAEGELVNVSIRVSEDGSTAWVSIEGRPEIEWSGNGSMTSGEWTHGSTVLAITSTGGLSEIQIGDDYAGVIGALTETYALPGGTPTYRGDWHTISSDGEGRGNGSISLDIDFSNGTIGGDVKGAYARSGLGGGAVKGTVDGSIEGSIMTGSILIDERNISGMLLFLGGIYGENGENAQGLLGGALTTSAGTDAQVGEFSLTRTGN